MQQGETKDTAAPVSRRDFLKVTAAAAATAAMTGVGAEYVHAAGSDQIKVGLIGCGGRGTSAAANCVSSSKGIVIWSAGDIFKDKTGRVAGQFNIPADRCFGGFDNYEKVIASGVDMIILATPPGFRAAHFKAAIDAGKHVFTEKPVCVDPPTYRMFVEASEAATQKKLCVVAGTQRRHQNSYRECMKRVLAGDIGQIQSGQCYWIGGLAGPSAEKAAGMSDIEWQIRNWYEWSWTCGDHIVEQHVHNIDIMNWALGGPPVKCIAVGGRAARTKPGNIFDHFGVEYEYAGGVRVASYCAQYNRIGGRVSEALEGTKGRSNCNGSISGEKPYNFSGENPDPYVQEHTDLLAAIRGTAPYVNEGKQVADSTFTAVLGRMSAYTGREINWAWATKESKLSLLPPKMEFGAFQPHETCVPGKTQLI